MNDTDMNALARTFWETYTNGGIPFEAIPDGLMDDLHRGIRAVLRAAPQNARGREAERTLATARANCPDPGTPNDAIWNGGRLSEKRRAYLLNVVGTILWEDAS